MDGISFKLCCCHNPCSNKVFFIKNVVVSLLFSCNKDTRSFFSVQIDRAYRVIEAFRFRWQSLLVYVDVVVTLPLVSLATIGAGSYGDVVDALHAESFGEFDGGYAVFVEAYGAPAL